MMLQNGRYSPASVITDGFEKSPARFPADICKPPRSCDSSFDSSDSLGQGICVEARGHQNASPAGKCRLLPCRTYVSTGSCCYGDRCVFLHDQSLLSKPVFMKFLKKSKDDNVPDAFFWPMMPQQLVKNKLDTRNQPDINQAYLIPAPYIHSNANLSSNMNHFAVYSMWEHFVDYLATDTLSVVKNPRPVPVPNCSSTTNRYTGRKRLDVFQTLSAGQSV